MPVPMDSRPLLTIAIPTYNRAGNLRELLAALGPQFARCPQVELLISDNASPDDTPAVVAEAALHFDALGVAFRAQRHPVNLGADANFAACYTAARGTYFWALGDDDILLPGELQRIVEHLDPARVDLVYVTSYGFHTDPIAERRNDPLGRRFHTVRDARKFALIVNMMFTFISGIIVNKDRLESIPHEDPAAFVGTNLVQLSWSLPLLRDLRSAIVLYERPLASRLGHAHGYSLGKVFGAHLKSNVERLLPSRPDLSSPIFNFALRRWFPALLVDLRASGNSTLQLEEVHAELRRAFGRNARYWLFTYPALKLPLPLARLHIRALGLLNHVVYIGHLPTFYRKQT